MGQRKCLSTGDALPYHEVIGMPSLSPTMESGTIAKWNFSEGESFAAGDSIAVIETDKATIDFEAQDEGVIAKIIAEAGSGEINCGTPILVTVDNEGDVAAFKDYTPETSVPAAAAASDEKPAAPTPAPAVASPPAAQAVPKSDRVFASPRAHTLAKAQGLGDVAALRIVGTGPGGRIVAQDVVEYEPVAAVAAAVEEPARTVEATAPSAPVAGPGYTEYALPDPARELAARLHASKQNVPHYYLTIDLAMDALVALRARLNSAMSLDEDDTGITVNDLLLKSAAAAMKTVPAANASWLDGVVRVYDAVDVNVVVGRGANLYSPVVRDVGRRGLRAVASDMARAAAVVEGAKSDDLATASGFGDVGTFTMVNLGAFGVKSCAPIVREPQACALALGAIEKRIVPNDDKESEDIYKESLMMTATVSLDHRVVDGAVGAQWLAAFKNHVENPVTLLL